MLVHGRPQVIRSDQGTEFLNATMREMALLLNFKHKSSTPYHHESVGTIERSHRIMNEYLRAYCQTNKDWYSFVGAFAYCYNTTPNETIGMYTPFELVHGRKAPPLFWQSSKDAPLGVVEYVNSLKKVLDLARRRAEQFMLANKRYQKIRYDRDAAPLSVDVGDRCLLVNESRCKLDPYYTSGFVVEECLGCNVKLKSLSSGKTFVVHKNRVRRV